MADSRLIVSVQVQDHRFGDVQQTISTVWPPGVPITDLVKVLSESCTQSVVNQIAERANEETQG